MTQSGDHTEDDIALVGEYALHLLDAGDRLAFEQRLAVDPALQDVLRAWDEGLVALADDIAPVAPPPHVKTALDIRLFGAAKRGAWLPSFLGLRAALLTLAFLAILIVVAGPRLWVGPDRPVYVAEIAAQDQSLVVLASFDPDTAEITINRTTGAAMPGRALELWLIAEGATAPVSLGVMSDAQMATIVVPDSLRPAVIGGTLAISDEPAGGSPTGAPTGAVLAVGAVVTS